MQGWEGDDVRLRGQVSEGGEQTTVTASYITKN